VNGCLSDFSLFSIMSFEKLKDKAIYSRLVQKDKDAFIKAYDLYIDDIYRFVFFKINNQEEAEDITSLVFLRCWEYIQNNSIKDYKTLKALFYKVARNLIIDHYRKKSSRQSIVKEEDISAIDIVDETQNPQIKFENEYDLQIVKDKIFLLKDEYREVIILNYINDLSISEIAQIMDKSKGNVRILLFRALKALRDLVKNKN
jgi:RNA polymerase sigma-70 factor, ECF subfamily